MNKLNFPIIDSSVNPFESIVRSIKIAAKFESNATGSKLSHSLDIVTKHSSYNN